MLGLSMVIVGLFVFPSRVHAEITTDNNGYYHITNGNDLDKLIVSASTPDGKIPDTMTIIFDRDIRLNEEKNTSPLLKNVILDANGNEIYYSNQGLGGGVYHVTHGQNKDSTFTLRNLTVKSTTKSYTYPSGTYYSKDGTPTTTVPTYGNSYGIVFAGNWGTAASDKTPEGTIIYENVKIDYSSITDALQTLQMFGTWSTNLVFRGDNEFVSPTANQLAQSFGEIANLTVESGKTTLKVTNKTAERSAVFPVYDNALQNGVVGITINEGAELNLDITSESSLFSADPASTVGGTGFKFINNGTFTLNRPSTSNAIFDNVVGALNKNFSFTAGANSVTKIVTGVPFYDNAEWSGGNVSIDIGDNATFLMVANNKSPFDSVATTKNPTMRITNPKAFALISAKNTNPFSTFVVNATFSNSATLYDTSELTSSYSLDTLDSLFGLTGKTVLSHPTVENSVVKENGSLSTTVPSTINKLNFRGFVNDGRVKFGFTPNAIFPTFNGVFKLADYANDTGQGPYYVPALQSDANFYIDDPDGLNGPKTVTAKLEHEFERSAELVLRENGTEKVLNANAEVSIFNSQSTNINKSGNTSGIYSVIQDNTTQLNGFFFKGTLDRLRSGSETNTVVYTLYDTNF
jgi:hypothetical protein